MLHKLSGVQSHGMLRMSVFRDTLPPKYIVVIKCSGSKTNSFHIISAVQEGFMKMKQKPVCFLLKLPPLFIKFNKHSCSRLSEPQTEPFPLGAEDELQHFVAGFYLLILYL